MLTSYQVETVAFVTDGGIICRDCAIRQYGEYGVAALEEGIAEFLPSDVSPLIRYELDTLLSEQANEYANEEVGGYDDHEDDWNTAYDNAPDSYPCDECGGEIS
jgi:hypothetical protein